MTRRYLLALLALTPLAAAPVPREDEAAKLRHVYGAWSDRDGDCAFKLSGGELRVSLPAKEHALASPVRQPRGAENAPRVLREVEGDFVAVVRVAFPLPARGPAEKGKFACAGGLLAWVDQNDWVAVRRCAVSEEDLAEEFWSSQREGFVTSAKVHPSAKPEGSGLVRLRREGGEVRTGWSRDGKEWKEFGVWKVKWGGPVKVGVVAENSLKAPVEVTFDRYELTQPKK